MNGTLIILRQYPKWTGITLRVTTDLSNQYPLLVNGIVSCNQISFHYLLTTSVLLFNYQTETVEPLRGLWMSVHPQDSSWQTQGHCVLSVAETRKLHILLDGNMIDAKDSCRELRSSRHAVLLFLQIERLIQFGLTFLIMHLNCSVLDSSTLGLFY